MTRIDHALRGRRLALAVGLVVLCAGQLAVGMRASATSPVTGDEPFYLVSAQSLLTDGDLDLRDEYEQREYESWWRGTVPLWRQMDPAPDGRLLAPHEPGLSVLIVPGFALAGVAGVQRELVVLWAAAAAAAAVVARRRGAPAWAAAAAAVALGIGAPGIVYGSQVYPEGPAALAVAAGLLVLTSTRTRPLLLALCAVALAWLGIKYIPIAALLAGAWAWRWRAERRAVAVAAAVCAVAGAHWIVWHVSTFGGLTPYGVNVVWAGQDTATLVADHFDWSGRTYRLYGLLLDARFGLLRWSPVAVLAAWGLARPHWREAALVVLALVMGTFASITMMGWWFPGRLLASVVPAFVVLVAAGIARLPRLGAVLGLLSVAIGAQVAIAAHRGSIRLAVDPFELPPPLPPSWLFPDFRAFGVREVALSCLWGAAVVAGVLWTRRHATARGRVAGAG